MSSFCCYVSALNEDTVECMLHSHEPVYSVLCTCISVLISCIYVEMLHNTLSSSSQMTHLIMPKMVERYDYIYFDVPVKRFD